MERSLLDDDLMTPAYSQVASVVGDLTNRSEQVKRVVALRALPVSVLAVLGFPDIVMDRTVKNRNEISE